MGGDFAFGDTRCKIQGLGFFLREPNYAPDGARSMTKPLKYHSGEIAVQQRANAFDPADLDGNGLGSTFDPRISAFLRSQRWAIISGLDSDRKVWVSCIWGSPGFMNLEAE